jgi:DNA-binding IclR family transcriptional regulator
MNALQRNDMAVDAVLSNDWLFRGATAKVVLAHLPTRTLKKLFAEHSKEIKAASLGHDWETFKKTLAVIRRAGACITKGEVDQGRVGIAAPAFASDGSVLGSLSSVLPAYCADETLVGRILSLTTAGALEIERSMQAGEISGAAIEPRRKCDNGLWDNPMMTAREIIGRFV